LRQEIGAILFAFQQQILELAGEGSIVVRVEEADGLAFMASSARTANTVDVLVNLHIIFVESQ
jgi:hypothetical protein